MHILSHGRVIGVCREWRTVDTAQGTGLFELQGKCPLYVSGRIDNLVISGSQAPHDEAPATGRAADSAGGGGDT